MEDVIEMGRKTQSAETTGAAPGPNEERARRLRAKNRVLLLILLAFVVLVYFVSIVRMGGS